MTWRPDRLSLLALSACAGLYVWGWVLIVNGAGN